MKKLTFLLLFFLILYIVLIAETRLSFIGLWSDVYFTISLSFLIILLTIVTWNYQYRYRLALNIISLIIPLIIIVGTYHVVNIQPRYNEFDYPNINNKSIKAYLYPPYGVWEGENGILEVFIISKKIPMLELQIYYGQVPEELYDKGSFEKDKIKQKKITKNYIEQVILLPTLYN